MKSWKYLSFEVFIICKYKAVQSQFCLKAQGKVSKYLQIILKAYLFWKLNKKTLLGT